MNWVLSLQYSTTEIFVASVYTFDSINNFVNTDNRNNSNYWELEDNFDFFEPIFTVAMIEDQQHKEDLRHISYEIANNELLAKKFRSIEDIKKRTAIIIEYAIRNYALKKNISFKLKTLSNHE